MDVAETCKIQNFGVLFLLVLCVLSKSMDYYPLLLQYFGTSILGEEVSPATPVIPPLCITVNTAELFLKCSITCLKNHSIDGRTENVNKNAKPVGFFIVSHFDLIKDGDVLTITTFTV